MKLIGNIIWLLVGGLETAFEYFTAGVVLCITIIGIPFGLQAFKLGVLMLWPFGSSITIIGIPFGMQHFKFAGIALTPFGRTVVSDI